MTGRLFPTILILPGTVLVLVPAIIFWAAVGTGYAGNWAGLGQGQLWAGVGSLAAGLLLTGEALLYQSWPLAAWGLLFFAANAVDFPLSEEKGLERRFGGDYRTYKANVPRWFPRIRPWRPADE